MFKYPKTIKEVVGISFATLLCAGGAFAQDDLADEDEVYVLSPFEVTAADEDGYLATSSLAGSRLNTNLTDIGSSISVYTEEFLDDIQATDNETLLSYGLNTEVGGFRGNFVNPDSNGIENANLEEPHTNTRIRGLTRADNTLNYYKTDVPWDGYIVRRVDIQRGANSILFGLGSPAGIINATKIEALFDDFGEGKVRFDGWGSARASLDYNRTLIDDVLAVRVALLAEDKKFQQKPAFEDTERGYLALTYAPEALNTKTSSFRVKASFESGTVESNRPRMVAPIDKFSMWLAPASESGVQGSFAPAKGYGFAQNPHNQYNDYLAATGEENFNPWIASFFDGITPLVQYEGAGIMQIREKASNDRGSWYFDTDLLDSGATAAVRNDGSASDNGRDIERHISHPGQVSLNGLQRVADGLGLAHPGFWRDRSITDTKYFDFYKNLIDGDTKRENRNWQIWEIDITQTFMDNKFGYSFGAFNQQYETEFMAALGNVFAPAITVDIGMWDVTSQPNAMAENPMAGRVMVRDENSSGRERSNDRESLRLQAFFKHDFTENRDSLLSNIMGSHELVVVGQTRSLDQKGRNFNLMGMGRDYLLERGETIANEDTPGPGARLAEYNRNIGSVEPDLVYYVGANADYTGIGRIGASLDDLPWGTVSIRGFDATPLPGFTAEIAALPWDGDPFNANRPADVEPAGGGAFQSENPEQYVGWVDSVGSYYIANAVRSEEDREYLTTTKTFFTEEVETVAGVWTGRWLQGGIVGMFGWRRDDVTETWYEHDYRDDGADFDLAQDRSERSTTVESRNWSLKANLTYLTGLSNKLPFDVHVLYAEGEVQTPDPTRVDVFGRTLPNSLGNTEDLSVMITSSDGKWSFRATKYETIVKNAVSNASVNQNKFRLQQVLQQGAFRAGLIETNAQNYTADWLPLSDSAAAAGFATEAEYRQQIMAPGWREFERGLWEQFPLTRGWYVSDFQPGDQSPPKILFPDNATIVEDSISEGWEFEFVGNLTKNWNVAINASKTEAIRDNLPGDEFGAVIDYVANAMAGPAGEIPIWWFSGPGVGTWLDPFLGEVTKAATLNGTVQPEIRKWKGNVVTNYNFTDGNLSGFGVGGAYRYEDSQIYGYGLGFDADGNTTVELNQPYKDDVRHTFDFWVNYRRDLTDKIDWRIQLNVFNAFGDNELVPLSINPDGTVGLQGIKEGMSWAVTNTFSF